MAYEFGQIVDGSDGAVLFTLATRPMGFFARLRGLLGHRDLNMNEAWWFGRCSAVHTLGMRFVIDVVHLDADGRVVRVDTAVKPGRWSVVAGGCHAVELAAGAAGRAAIHTGQVLRFRT